MKITAALIRKTDFNKGDDSELLIHSRPAVDTEPWKHFVVDTRFVRIFDPRYRNILSFRMNYGGGQNRPWPRAHEAKKQNERGHRDETKG